MRLNEKISKKIKLFLIIIINIILQLTIFPNFKILGASPNATIPLVVAFSLCFGPFFGGYLGLFLGIIEDVFFSNVIGVRALIYFVCGFLIGESNARINKNDYRTGLFLTIISNLFYYGASLIIFKLLGRKTSIINYMFASIYIEIFENLVIFFIINKILNKFFTFNRFRL